MIGRASTLLMHSLAPACVFGRNHSPKPCSFTITKPKAFFENKSCHFKSSWNCRFSKVTKNLRRFFPMPSTQKTLRSSHSAINVQESPLQDSSWQFPVCNRIAMREYNKLGSLAPVGLCGNSHASKKPRRFCSQRLIASPNMAVSLHHFGLRIFHK